MSYSESIASFLSFLRSCTEHTIDADLEDANNKLCDIEHMIELEDLHFYDFARLGKAMRTVRQERRTAKDTLSVLAPIRAWVADNTDVIHALQRLLGEVRKAEGKLENRYYNPKTDFVDKVLSAETKKCQK